MMFRNTSPIDFANDSSSSSHGAFRRTNSRGFDQMTQLAPGYVPGDGDVLVGRGKKCLVHTGNLRFKQIVATKLSAYLAAECRVDKTAILMEVIAEVRANSPNGGFVKQNPKTGQFFEVGDFLAKEKTAQAFRDALHEYYSSSNPSKKKRRIQSTISSEKKSNSSSHGSSSSSSIQEEGNEMISSSAHEREQTLVSAMHSQFTRRQSKSAPSSPIRDRFDVDLVRSATPPPTFARSVTAESTLQQRVASSQGQAKRHSSAIILGDTLAMLSSALMETGIDGSVHPDECVSDDPFEPIPLSKYDDMAISDHLV